MLRTILRRTAYALGALVALAGIAYGAMYFASERRIDQPLTVEGHALTVSTDSATLARGQHVATALGMCGDCHGPDFGGMVVINEPAVAVLSGANLTAGEGGVGGAMTDLDWERAIRHGVAPDGRKLLFMPSHEYTHLNDPDMAALIAYLKQLPKVSRTPQPNKVGPIGRALFLKGDLALLPAELIDQAAAHAAPVPAGETVEYGSYLANACRGCHNPSLSGGAMAGAPPEWTPPANITPGGIGHYSEADFFRALREGKRPDGSPLDTVNMPVRFTRLLTDAELRALRLYLQSVPSKQYAER